MTRGGQFDRRGRQFDGRGSPAYTQEAIARSAFRQKSFPNKHLTTYTQNIFPRRKIKAIFFGKGVEKNHFQNVYGEIALGVRSC
jgi:hypothetical protein